MTVGFRCLRIVGLIGAVLLQACDAAPRQVHVEDGDLGEALIQVEDMPARWTTRGPSLPGAEPRRSRDSASITFMTDLYPEAYGAGEDIYRFSSVSAAEADFAQALQEFTAGNYVPSDWAKPITAADQAHFSCRDYSGVAFPVCIWIGRFGSAVVQVSGWLVPGRLSLEDLRAMIHRAEAKVRQLRVGD